MSYVTGYDYFSPVSQEDALLVRCPRCLAARGHPCTYIADRMVSRRESGWYEPRVIVHRKGDPMTGLHPERREVVRRRRHRNRQLDRQVAVTPAGREIREAAAAMRAWDLAEYERLRAWLREHGHLLAAANRIARQEGGTL